MVSPPIITFINHASVVLDYGRVRILSDPWLSGSVFNNGWELQVPTPDNVFDFSTITHLYISHEHPDHFHPPSLKKILELSPRLTVLFQETADHRVADYFSNRGVRVHELKSEETLFLSESCSIQIGKNGIEDSWALFQLGEYTILNLNDCIFPSRADIHRLAKFIGSVDVLLSNFSYAEKVGNAPDVQERLNASARLRKVALAQIEEFRPETFIPFASYKYFSNVENFYMNDGISRIADVVCDFSDLPGTCLNVMQPGDSWIVGTSFDSSPAIARYSESERQIAPQSYTESASSISDLSSLATKMVTNVTRLNSRFLTYRLLMLLPYPFGIPKVTFWLTDLNVAVSLDLKFGLRQLEDVALDSCDLVASSPSVRYMLSAPFGANSLMVNARYQTRASANSKLFILSHVLLMYGASIPVNSTYIRENLRRILVNLASRLRFRPSLLRER